MIKLVYDISGNVVRFIDTLINDDVVDDAIEITPAQHLEILKEPSAWIVDVVAGRILKRVAPTRTVESYLADAKSRVSSSLGVELQSIVAGYSFAERETWGMQQEEAAAINSGANVTTPLIDRMALVSGESRESIAERIVKNASNFALSAADLLGKKRKLFNDIDSIYLDASATDNDKIGRLININWGN